MLLGLPLPRVELASDLVLANALSPTSAVQLTASGLCFSYKRHKFPRPSFLGARSAQIAYFRAQHDGLVSPPKFIITCAILVWLPLNWRNPTIRFPESSERILLRRPRIVKRTEVR